MNNDGKVFFDPNNIPEDVVNIDAYKKYCLITQHEAFDNRMHLCSSDEELIIDLMTPWNRILEKIDHLEQFEKKQIKIKHSSISSARSRRTRLRDKAFGRRNKRSDYVLAPKTGELIELFGKYHTLDEVHEIVCSKWGYDVSKQVVADFRRRFMPKIEERQKHFLKDYSDVRLTHKKSRLLELSELYMDRKRIYQRTKNKEDYKLLLATLRQLNQEVEGDKLIVEGNIQVDIQHTVNLQIQREIMQKTNILDIVLSRIAARNNINPVYLLTKLHKSLYAKYSGFGETFERADEADEVHYPSMLVYNFDRIQSQAQEYQENETKLKQFEQEDPVKKKQGSNWKAKMKQKIAKRTTNLKNNREDIKDM